MTDEEIIRETLDDYRRNKKIMDKLNEEGKEQKKLEEIKAQIPTFTHKNISQISSSLTETENLAAANYVDFQRHFVKLNSILNKALDGVVLL